MANLKIGKIRRQETVKLSGKVPISANDDFSLYMDFYKEDNGETITKDELLTEILVDFFESDKAFQTRKKTVKKENKAPASGDPSDHVSPHLNPERNSE